MAEISSAPKGGAKQRTKVRAKRMSTRLDMTPMVDLAFLLLTFFVLTTSLLKSYVIPLRMPEKQTTNDPQKPVSEKRVITLILDEKNAVYWYAGLTDPKVSRTDFSRDGVTDLMIQKKKEIDKLVVLVKPSEKSCYKNLVDIIDELTILNVDYYVVKITQTDKDLVSDHKAVAMNQP
jgi:biopolymer transport protein ExbD